MCCITKNRLHGKGVEIVAFKITDVCTACGACEMDCPVGPIYVIDADECTSCGVCTGSCPSGAIIED